MKTSSVLLALAVLTLAGCGGTSSTAGQTGPANAASTPTSSAPTGSTAPATTAPSTTSTPASTTTPAATPATLCRAADLSPSFLGGQAATGHGLLGFALRNVSGHACSTFGYPGVQFLTRSGQPLPTIPAHTTQDYFGSLPKLVLTVAPGATISFRLGVTHGAAATAGCATAYGLQVIPPNDTGTLRTAITNGAYECQTTTVSPVQQGNSAYP